MIAYLDMIAAPDGGIGDGGIASDLKNRFFSNDDNRPGIPSDKVRMLARIDPDPFPHKDFPSILDVWNAVDGYFFTPDAVKAQDHKIDGR